MNKSNQIKSIKITVKTLVLNKHQTGSITGPIWNGVNLTPLRYYFNTSVLFYHPSMLFQQC